MISTEERPHQTPPSAVAYVLPAIHSKRIRTVTADGTEEAADDNPWVHMQLKDPFQQVAASDGKEAEGASADAGDPEAVQQEHEELPKPEEVIKSFVAAKGELEWLLALLNTLQEGKYLTVGRSERSAGLQRVADMAVATNSRFQQRAAAAAAASVALSEGAAALRAVGQKEDAFYAQVAQLQRYWKVHQEPADSPYAYSVSLDLLPPDSSSTSSIPGSGASMGSAVVPAAPSAADAAAQVGRGPTRNVFILKDPAGNLRVQVPAPKAQVPPTVTCKTFEQQPEVFTGPTAIHGLLLRQLRLNAWQMVVDSLDEEISCMLHLPTHMKGLLAAAQHQQGKVPQQQQQGPDAQQQSKGHQQQQQPTPTFNAGGHLALFASLASLVLQSVAGAAGTAGEEAMRAARLQQQQHGSLESTGPCQQGVGSAELDVSTFYGVDVGLPWQQAAATAAARLGCQGRHWTAEPGLTSSDSSSRGLGCSLMQEVCVNAQLLAMRPVALEHLLITQLGHLVSSLHLDKQMNFMAPISYAAAARQMQDKARQRLEQIQHQTNSRGEETAGGSAAAVAAAAGQLALKPGSYKFGRHVSFLQCWARWLEHAAHRDVVRHHTDLVLQRHPGVMARLLSSSHSCVSAMQVARSPLSTAAATVAPAVAPVHSGCDNRLLKPPSQQDGRSSAWRAAAVARDSELLLLLTDWQLQIDATAASGLSAATPESVCPPPGTLPTVSIHVPLPSFQSILEQQVKQLFQM